MGQRLIPLVTQERFAEIACLDGNAFGVISSCEPCDDFNFPSCMRRSLRDALLGDQTRAENFLGYDLSITYQEEEILWGGESRIQLRRQGIAALNVKPAFEVIDTYDISPYVLENITIVDISGVKTVTMPRVYVDNPGNITVRNHANGSVIQQDTTRRNYPQRSGDDWIIALDVGNSTPTAVDIQHCKYMTLTIDTLTDECEDGTVLAASVGTHDFLPFAKPPVQNGSETIYFFYTWSLVDPAFKDDEIIDLLNGQFYKLVEQIDLLCITDEPALPVLLSAPDGCNEDFTLAENEDLGFTIIKDNIIEIRWSNSACCSPGNPVRLKIFYKTDPALLRVDLANMEMAIVYLTAAELPNVACNCEVPDKSFVSEAKKPYNKVFVDLTGAVYASQRYGTLHGHMVYAERISKEKRAQRLVVL